MIISANTEQYNTLTPMLLCDRTVMGSHSRTNGPLVELVCCVFTYILSREEVDATLHPSPPSPLLSPSHTHRRTTWLVYDSILPAIVVDVHRITNVEDSRLLGERSPRIAMGALAVFVRRQARFVIV